MKQSHVINIGYPKCGTTWLWKMLEKNRSIAYHPIKENNCLITGTPVDEYCDQYSHDVTANFSVMLAFADQYIIEQLSNIPQVKASIILRNHIDLLWSLYTFHQVEKFKDLDFQTYCYQIYDTKMLTRTSLVIQRWKQYFGDRFNIFWYDDLKKNNLEFYLDYCDKMQLDPGHAELSEQIKVTNYTKPMPSLDQDLIDLLKSEDKKLESYKT
jgi:hypothetical protein